MRLEVDRLAHLVVEHAGVGIVVVFPYASMGIWEASIFCDVVESAFGVVLLDAWAVVNLPMATIALLAWAQYLHRVLGRFW